jgi:hypothetical protein
MMVKCPRHGILREAGDEDSGYTSGYFYMGGETGYLCGTCLCAPFEVAKDAKSERDFTYSVSNCRVDVVSDLKAAIVEARDDR